MLNESLKNPVNERTYSRQSVICEFPVGPLHHLIAVIIRVQRPVVLHRGAGPEHHLCVETDGAQGVGLLQPVTRQLGPKAFWDSGGD